MTLSSPASSLTFSPLHLVAEAEEEALHLQLVLRPECLLPVVEGPPGGAGGGERPAVPHTLVEDVGQTVPVSLYVPEQKWFKNVNVWIEMDWKNKDL